MDFSALLFSSHTTTDMSESFEVDESDDEVDEDDDDDDDEEEEEEEDDRLLVFRFLCSRPLFELSGSDSSSILSSSVLSGDIAPSLFAILKTKEIYSFVNF